MRKIRIVLAATALAGFVFYLVSTSVAKPIAPSMQVGVLTADYGELYFAGPVQRAAAKLAAKDLLDSTGLKVNLSFQDGGDTETDMVSVLNRLKTFESDVLLAPIESTQAKFLSEKLLANPIPIISTAPLEEGLGLKKDKTWFFRLASTSSQDASALADYVSQEKPTSCVLVFANNSYSKALLRTIAFGLSMRGVRVQTLPIADRKSIKKLDPDALILISLEESVPFMSEMKDWVGKINKVYLVPGNMADYSSYAWARYLEGAVGLTPQAEPSASIRIRLATALGNQALLGQRGRSILALGSRTYDAVTLAGLSYLKAKSPSRDSLREAIANSQGLGGALFEENGYLNERFYSVLKYSTAGTYAVSSTFSPD